MGDTLFVMPRLLIAVACIVAEHGFQGMLTSAVETHGLSSWGSRAQAQYLWHIDLVALWHVGVPGSGIKPLSPALAGRFFTTEKPEKPSCSVS